MPLPLCFRSRRPLAKSVGAPPPEPLLRPLLCPPPPPPLLPLPVLCSPGDLLLDAEPPPLPLRKLPMPANDVAPDRALWLLLEALPLLPLALRLPGERSLLLLAAAAAAAAARPATSWVREDRPASEWPPPAMDIWPAPPAMDIIIDRSLPPVALIGVVSGRGSGSAAGVRAGPSRRLAGT